MRVPFDIIGSREKAVAVITDTDMKIGDAREAAREIMKRYKHVKAVVQKICGREGKYRTFKKRYLYGTKDTEVIHKEYGYKIAVDPLKVFFSPREAEDRQRVARQVKNGERILYLFSGAIPYALAIAKKKKVEIVCVETNPEAIAYAEKNVQINRLSGVKIINMDARDCGSLGKFDRILMPIITSIDYLACVRECSKPGTIIHLYGKTRDNGKDMSKRIRDILKNRCRILGIQKVSNYSPGIEKVRVDVMIA